MKFLRLSALFAGAVFLTGVPVSRAQDAADTAHGMSVRLMSWDGALADLWVADGGSYVAAKAGEFVLGRALALKHTASSLRLYKDQVVEGVLRKRPVADVSLPGGTSSMLVVLAPAPDGGPLSYQGRALDESLEAHPLNTMRVVNFSKLKLALKIGDTTSVVAPGAEEIFPFPSGGLFSITAEVAVDTASGWTMVQRSLQPAPPGRRILAMVRDGRPDYSIEDPELRTKPVDVVFLVDRAPPAVAVVRK